MEWCGNMAKKNQLYLDETAEPEPVVPAGGADVAVQDRGVRGDVQVHQGPVCPPDGEQIPHKTHQLGVLAEFTAWGKREGS